MSMSHGSMQAALLYGPRHIALETIPMPTPVPPMSSCALKRRPPVAPISKSFCRVDTPA